LQYYQKTSRARSACSRIGFVLLTTIWKRAHTHIPS